MLNGVLCALKRQECRYGWINTKYGKIVAKEATEIMSHITHYLSTLLKVKGDELNYSWVFF